MIKLLVLAMCMIGCGADHERERKEVCEHSEGLADGDCNAGDDFSPLTCITAMDQFENWWRGDAQTAINHCLSSSACYTSADNITGPSIVVPLQFCLKTELISSLQPTDGETRAVSRYCIKASQCGKLGAYTIIDCEEVLLSPYDDGQLFLMMNDQVSSNIANCDKLSCADFDNCVLTSLHLAGAFSSVMNTNINIPKLMNIN